jgi:hypothetical protein
MTGLHLVPSSFQDPAMRFHGSSKDIHSRRLYFEARGLRVPLVPMERRDADIDAILPGAPERTPDFVLLEEPGPPMPRLCRSLRRRFPRAKLVVRPMNAEAWHRLDWARAAPWGRETLHGLRGFVRGLWGGWRMARVIDEIWPICEADAVFWRLLAGESKVKVVPYFNSVGGAPSAPSPKRDECVCLGAVVTNPFIEDAVRRFSGAVVSLAGDFPEWTFTVTGVPTRTSLPARVRRLGLLPDTGEVLARSRVMALLSDHGRGVKTKILDAVQAGVWVAATPTLISRLPRELHPWCLPVRPGNASDFKKALASSRRAPPEGDPNAVFRDEAFSVMGRSLSFSQTIAPPSPNG